MAGIGIIGILDGVAEDADDANNLASLSHTVWDVAGVTDQLLAAGHLSLRFYTHHLAILHDDVIHWFVQHVCSPIDGTQSGKALRQLAQAIEWVQIWALAIPGQGLTVQLDAVNSLKTWLIQVTTEKEPGNML